MGYEQFLETVKDLLQKKLGPEHSLEIHPVPKNNGVVLDGISDHASSSPLAPTVYLGPYYARCERGEMTVSETVTEIARILMDNPPPDSIRTEDFGDYVRMRPRIMMKLIHAASNRELLKDVPSVPYLDLAIVFYLFLERGERGQMTALIHNEQLAQWNITPLELLQRAVENTPDFYPAQIQDLDTAILAAAHAEGISGADTVSRPVAKEAADLPLYVLTNTSGIYGAACILYRQVLKNFADRLGQDLLILPSSVHEVILAPFSGELDLAALNNMITAINQYEVPAEDRLSNHIYRYLRESDRITIPQAQTASL